MGAYGSDCVISIRRSRASSSSARKLTTSTGTPRAVSNSALNSTKPAARERAQDVGHVLAHRQLVARDAVVLAHLRARAAGAARRPRRSAALTCGQPLDASVLLDPHLARRRNRARAAAARRASAPPSSSARTRAGAAPARRADRAPPSSARLRPRQQHARLDLDQHRRHHAGTRRRARGSCGASPRRTPGTAR